MNLPKHLFYFEGEFPLSKILRRAFEISGLNLHCNVGSDVNIVLAPLDTQSVNNQKFIYYGFYFVGFQEKVLISVADAEQKVYIFHGRSNNYLVMLLCMCCVDVKMKQDDRHYAFSEWFKAFGYPETNEELVMLCDKEEEMLASSWKEGNADVEYFYVPKWGRQKWNSKRVPKAYRLTPMPKMPTQATYLPFGGINYYSQSIIDYRRKISYYKWENAELIDVQQSLVLAIRQTKKLISFKMLFCLVEGHPLYQMPEDDEKCYRKGYLTFLNPISIIWQNRNWKSKKFNSLPIKGEQTLGYLYELSQLDDKYLLYGDWGDVTIQCSQINITYDE